MFLLRLPSLEEVFAESEKSQDQSIDDLKQTLQDAKELKEKLTKEIKDIQTSVKNIISNTQALIGEYRSDMAKARRAWQGMADSMAKSRKTGVIAKIETGEKTDTGEEKGKKRGRKAKRGRK